MEATSGIFPSYSLIFCSRGARVMHHPHFGKLGPLILVSALAYVLTGNGQGSNDSAYDTIFGPPRTIVSENVYNYRVAEYRQSARVMNLTKPAQCPKQTPEETLIAMVSAMANLDYTLWTECWAEDSRQDTSQETRAQMVSAWRRVVVGRTLILLHKIETGQFVLIEYKLSSSSSREVDNASDEVTSTVTFEKVKDKWRATNALAADPVRLFWQKPDYRPRTVVR